MHAFKEHPVVFIGRHRQRRAASQSIGRAPVLVQPRGPLAHSNRNPLKVCRYMNHLDRWKLQAGDSLDFRSHLLNHPHPHSLPVYISFRSDSEQKMSAMLVELAYKVLAASRGAPVVF